MTDRSGTHLHSPLAGFGGADSREGVDNGSGDFNLDFHIDELVFHGLEHLDHREVRAELRRALRQLFAQRGVPSALNGGGRMESLNAGSFTASPEASAHDIGSQIAQAIYRSVKS